MDTFYTPGMYERSTPMTINTTVNETKIEANSAM